MPTEETLFRILLESVLKRRHSKTREDLRAEALVREAIEELGAILDLEPYRVSLYTRLVAEVGRSS